MRSTGANRREMRFGNAFKTGLHLENQANKFFPVFDNGIGRIFAVCGRAADRNEL